LRNRGMRSQDPARSSSRRRRSARSVGVPCVCFLCQGHRYLSNTLVLLHGDLCGSDGEWAESVSGFEAAEDDAMVSLVDGGDGEAGRRILRRPRDLAWVVFGGGGWRRASVRALLWMGVLNEMERADVSKLELLQASCSRRVAVGSSRLGGRRPSSLSDRLLVRERAPHFCHAFASARHGSEWWGTLKVSTTRCLERL
jgi:hypothetical protein